MLAYQGADQLRRFGAEIFTVDLLGVGFLREMGGLHHRDHRRRPLGLGLHRADRHHAASTRRSTRWRQWASTSAEVLVLPRVLGLVIALPLLTFYADIVGLLGGGVMCYFDLDITVPAFLRELQQAITVKTLLVGLIKAPVFAFIIALVGCFEGLQVERNAESVGQADDAFRGGVDLSRSSSSMPAFSILFSILGI